MKLGGSLERSRRRARSVDRATDGGPRIDGDILLKAAGIALVGWLVGYLISTRVLFPAPPPPGDLNEVPDVRGLELANAQEELASSGLELGPVDSLLHPSVPANVILGQSPLPGQVARPGTPVRVTVSLGPQRRAVPDVTGLSEDRARIVLETTGFEVRMDSVESEEPRGRVVEIAPAPGAQVVLPGEVRLTVSMGPPVITMPLVLGLPEDEAITLLDSLGLIVEPVEEVFRFGRDQGIVVEQEPASDSELQRGTPVRLKVGRRGLDRGNGDGNND
ncbi:MAG: PASTA domain-containing protein [Gemmatimonadales bacterium]